MDYMYFKVENLLNSNGEADYKGLDINLISMQVLPDDLITVNYCLIAYPMEAEPHDDLINLTKDEYEALRKDIEDNRPTPSSPEDEIATLKQQLADTEKKMDEAIVELTLAMTMGGMPNV
ncbi:hypothetical protein [Bacillus sp. Hm123]|uniref:hypothetical protein n=1 Tax=Bacillus sp. Hm123 TaxID=3450745 RepID=UPI003F42848E